jgi:leukotriene-A4 hydrolase
LADKWIAGEILEDREEFEKFSAEQQLEFLGILLESDKLEHDKLEKMDKLYGMSSSLNTEVLFGFVRLGIKARWEKSVELGLGLASRQGRMKFCRPLFRDMWGWEEQKERVEKCYKEHRGGMMAVCREIIGKDLGITD